MSYYALRTSEFTHGTANSRILYLLKKKDVPVDEVEDIVHLNCSSVKRVENISELLSYLQMNTSDATYTVKPYIIKRIKWNEAVDLFGFDYDSDSSSTDSASKESSSI